MSKERLSIITSFMPAMCMALLLGFEYAFKNDFVKLDILSAMGAEAVAFLLPLAIIMLMSYFSEGSLNMRVHKRVRRSGSFVFFTSLTVSLGAFLLNCLVASFKNIPAYGLRADAAIWDPAQPISLSILAAVIIVPAICEELFFRSGFFGIYEGNGTYAALIASAITFALIHGSEGNLVGPLLAGFAYGYMTYALGSIYPAIFAHIVNNIVFMAITKFFTVYEAFGIWSYFLIFVIFCFCFCLYMAMKRLEKLIEDGKIVRFKPASIGTVLASTVLSPGVWLLLLMFCFKVFYS